VSVALRAVRWPRKPAVHFAAIGALLFTLVGAWGGPATTSERVRKPIVLSASQVEQLLERYTQRTGLRATEQDARALVDRETDEDVLYSEALFRGLDRGDRGVQWRLIEKMTFLSDEPETNPRDLLGQAVGLALDREDQVVRRILIEKMRLALKHAGSADAPDDSELAAYLESHRDRFVQPSQVRISQVYLARERHPGSLERDAAKLMEELRRESVPPERAADRGDPFPLDSLASLVTERELIARFGSAFARAVAALEPGRWSEPIPSVFGLHLVFVHERIPARLPALAEVRGRVLYGFLAERREEVLAKRLHALRSEYEVHVEWPAWIASPSAAGRP